MMPQVLCESAFISEAKIVKSYKSGKCIVETYLQEADTPNQNERVYPQQVIDGGLQKLQPMIEARRFLGELDHPISDNPIRQTTVLYGECSHMLTEYGWENNLLKGVVETLPYTPKGKIMDGLIRDRHPVGFSLRGIADSAPRGQYKYIKAPLIVITYDCVSKPSNHKAVMTEIKQESLQILHENAQAICLENGVCYLPNYFDMLIEQKVINLKKKYWQ